MPVFQYTAIDPGGRKRRGTVSAAGPAQARHLVAGEGDLILEMHPLSRRNFLSFERKTQVSAETASAFAAELSGLLEGGAPIRQALEIQSGGKSPSSSLARAALLAIDTGGSLSGALKAHGGAASLLSEFAAAGEAGAGLGPLLEKGAAFLSSRSQAISQIRAALAYPLFILLLGLVALTTITLYVAPALAPMLESGQRGSVILVLADIGNGARQQASLIYLILAMLTLTGYLLIRRPAVREAASRWLLSLPVIRSISRDLDAGQSCEVLAALLGSGRTLDTSLRFAASLSGPALAASWRNIAARIRDGVPAGTAFDQATGLPDELRRLALLGERSSAFEASIRQAGRISHARAMRRISRLSEILGPAFVIALGGGIALMMLTILGAISSVGDGIQ